MDELDWTHDDRPVAMTGRKGLISHRVRCRARKREGLGLFGFFMSRQPWLKKMFQNDSAQRSSAPPRPPWCVWTVRACVTPGLSQACFTSPTTT